MQDPELPLISIVTATYNRSNVLRHTIRSVQAQTHEHWEMWIIGDACTDDTAEVVQAIADTRIHFYNLPQNVGEQSGPNNEGLSRVKGPYVAMLNHDDLWYPDHLKRLLDEIQDSNADLVFSPIQRVVPGSGPVFFGWFPKGRYHIGSTAPASSWLFRRDIVEQVGPWRFYREIRNIPSQDWLFRAWKMGLKLKGTQVPSVLAFSTNLRPGCYAERHESEQRAWMERLLKEPDLRTKILDEYRQQHSWKRVFKPHQWASLLYDLLRWSIMKAKLIYGTVTRSDPKILISLIKCQRRGQFIDHLRKIRGLSLLERK